jgi:hypothetical protein
MTRRRLLAAIMVPVALFAGTEAPAHGPQQHVVTIAKGPRLAVTNAPSSFLDPDRMHSVYLSNMTDYAIDRVAIVPSSQGAPPTNWMVLDPPLGRTCPFPNSQRCFDQGKYVRVTVSSCGAAYRVFLSWPMPDGSRGQAIADSITADCTHLHGVVVTLQ